MFQLGDILKAIREEKRLQLSEVQNQTGIDASQLSRFETGKRLPTVEQLDQLSNLYQIDSTLLRIERESDRIITSFDDPDLGLKSLEVAREKLLSGQKYLNMFRDSYLSEPIGLSSRRYIGSKAKLLDWIFETITSETNDIHSFCDIFAGTGVVAERATQLYDQVIINDLLYSNNVVYKAFFGPGEWNREKLCDIITGYNSLDTSIIQPNYFSDNFGGKFFEESEAKRIGYIRQDIENRRHELTEKEYSILLATLLYNIDKIANTLGHFEAYIQKPISHRPLYLKLIEAKNVQGVQIFREDSNRLARRIRADIVYIDPPYNSRQYSRFYHVYETLVKWDYPDLFGVAMKPRPENMSDYCSNRAGVAMIDLVQHLNCRYIAVSYNNTYKSKSTSSENKIQLEELQTILETVGPTSVFEHKHRAFNAGKTDFKDHKEYLFITRVNE